MSCDNPFNFKRKRHGGLHAIVVLDGEQKKICDKCWSQVAGSDLSW